MNMQEKIKRRQEWLCNNKNNNIINTKKKEAKNKNDRRE